MTTYAGTESPAGGSRRRIGALVLRHLYLLRSSWPRILELMYWPIVQMILWGLMTTFLLTNSTWIAQAAGMLIAGVLLWDVLFRGQLGFSLVFLEEMWSRNLGHLFVSPIRPWEIIVAFMTISLIRTTIGVLGASLLAVPLYHYSIFEMGLPLIAFFFNLIVMGWALGLVVTGILLRYGLGAESLAWVLVFALAPLSCIYYPIDILPDWLKSIAVLLPSTHVFEGMRSVLIDHTFRTDLLVNAVSLNLVYVAIGVAVFLRFFWIARMRGLLHQLGE